MQWIFLKLFKASEAIS